MSYLEKPKGYWFWVKYSARAALPFKHDFDGLGSSLWGAWCSAVTVFFKMIFRTLLLVSFPISALLFALALSRDEEETMLKRAKHLTEEWDGMPPQFTREEVDQVLAGEKTYEQLCNEKEKKWNS